MNTETKIPLLIAGMASIIIYFVTKNIEKAILSLGLIILITALCIGIMQECTKDEKDGYNTACSCYYPVGNINTKFRCQKVTE